MDFNEFKKYMQHIENSLKTQDKYCEIMSEQFLDDMAGYLVDDIIELLEKELDTKLISWFVFETNFGKENNAIGHNGFCEIYIKTIEDLWLFSFTGWLGSPFSK